MVVEAPTLGPVGAQAAPPQQLQAMTDEVLLPLEAFSFGEQLSAPRALEWLTVSHHSVIWASQHAGLRPSLHLYIKFSAGNSTGHTWHVLGGPWTAGTTPLP